MMTEILGILIAALLSQNFILVKFYGICPFMGVSKKIDTALGMGMAVTFVMALASAACYAINLLLIALNLEYMQTVAFILVIATLVQVVEMFLKKFVPALYKALGVFLPLITTNCAVLGVVLVNVQNGYNFLLSVVNGAAGGLGFTLAIVLFASVRERVNKADCPECFKGFPIALITAGLLGPGGAGIQIIPQPFPAMQLVMPVGGFLVLGFVLAGSQWLMKYLEIKNKKKEAAK